MVSFVARTIGSTIVLICAGLGARQVVGKVWEWRKAYHEKTAAEAVRAI